MSIVILLIFLCGIFIRTKAVEISIKNECRLKNNDAVEYGVKNSIVLSLLHTMCYGGSIIEAFIRKTQFNFNLTSILGVLMYSFSFVILFYVVKQLKGIWTTKIILAKDHNLNKSFLFKYVKHPNYYLNLIPELVGLALLCKAFYVLAFIFPLFLVTLIQRIFIEEEMMKSRFINY